MANVTNLPLHGGRPGEKWCVPIWFVGSNRLHLIGRVVNACCCCCIGRRALRKNYRISKGVLPRWVTLAALVMSITERAAPIPDRQIQVLVMGVTVWLARWSRQTEEEQEEEHYVAVLALLALAAIVVSLLRAVLTYSSLIKVRILPPNPVAFPK